MGVRHFNEIRSSHEKAINVRSKNRLQMLKDFFRGRHFDGFKKRLGFADEVANASHIVPLFTTCYKRFHVIDR